ncbi:carbohydrate sulfotransferase 1-like isoform X3 [Gigantopelta aegis]|nr:carbohydrate sulfotransferase 1-like isoform X3 [Gigantopelta aegis]XP_041372031.1 carbohydrate sulfotransferase 1-like isoform X3 [Gigantopelta aegis]
MIWARRRKRVLGVLLIIIAVGVFLNSSSFTPVMKKSWMQNLIRRVNNITIPKSSPKSMVIILTYMRSGSSLTGDIIQQSPDVFYVYEPLHSVNKLRSSSMLALYLSKKTEIRPSLSDTIEHFLSCDLENVDLYTLNQFHLKNSRSTGTYLVCVRGANGIGEMLTCLTSLVKTCAAAKVTVLKTIRMPMLEVSALLQKYPQLKVVHLVRDPRGTLLSQTRVGNFKWSMLHEVAPELCRKISLDLRISQNISDQFGSRIFTLRYEDLAENPVIVSRMLYDFVGLEFTDTIKDYIVNITQSGRRDGCAICTWRINSTATAYKWRRKLSYDRVAIIDNGCAGVYKQMGYLPIPKEKLLRNMSFPVKVRR